MTDPVGSVPPHIPPDNNSNKQDWNGVLKELNTAITQVTSSSPDDITAGLNNLKSLLKGDPSTLSTAFDSHKPSPTAEQTSEFNTYEVKLNSLSSTINSQNNPPTAEQQSELTQYNASMNKIFP